MSRLTRSFALSLVALAVVAGPVATPAAAGVIDYGAIAKCRYTMTQSYKGVWTHALLKRIAVQPPTIAKKVGTRSVGWRFIVERSLDRDNTPWVVTSRSPLQRASSSAGLTPMRVAVNVPPADQTPDGQDRVWYRVTLKMFRYTSDGSVQTKVSHVMYDHYVIVGGEEQWTDSICQGQQLQYI